MEQKKQTQENVSKEQTNVEQSQETISEKENQIDENVRLENVLQKSEKPQNQGVINAENETEREACDSESKA